MKTLREKIEVMEAFERGEKIQFCSSFGVWEDVTSPRWNWPAYDYRVAPEVIDPNVVYTVIADGTDGSKHYYRSRVVDGDARAVWRSKTAAEKHAAKMQELYPSLKYTVEAHQLEPIND